jgi:hypothetical protein
MMDDNAGHGDSALLAFINALLSPEKSLSNEDEDEDLLGSLCKSFDVCLVRGDAVLEDDERTSSFKQVGDEGDVFEVENEANEAEGEIAYEVDGDDVTVRTENTKIVEEWQ